MNRMNRRRKTWVAVSVAVVVPLGLAGGFFLERALRPAPPPSTIEATLDAGIDAPCASGLVPVAGGGCFAPPREPGANVALLLYLHGRYSPKTLDEELVRQARVARLGSAKGFAVLAMRGVQGECTQEELADTWCWPSNPRNAEHGPAFVERLKPAMAAARERVGPGPTVLLGFSNGAYFATLIATRALGPFDAIAIAHGGPVPPTRAAGATPPLLLITADDDLSDGEMRQLDVELTHERWAHELVAREGGHALPDWDVEMALTFFVRAQKESLPLAPPLQPFRPRPPKDAGEVDLGAPEADASSPADAAPAPEPEEVAPVEED
jgi:predicted esterase